MENFDFEELIRDLRRRYKPGDIVNNIWYGDDDVDIESIAEVLREMKVMDEFTLLPYDL